MNVNGVNSTTSSNYDVYQTSQAASTAAAAQTEETTEDVAAVYESSADTQEETSQTYTQNTELVAKLKADQENHLQQLQNIVQQLILKQSNAYSIANNLWETLASGDFEVDPLTQAQAQEDISEDGYYGVQQTADRILDFAKALTGGDPDKIEEMREAFIKGYSMAGSTWGSDLPSICQDTYDAVMAGFDEWAKEAGVSTD